MTTKYSMAFILKKTLYQLAFAVLLVLFNAIRTVSIAQDHAPEDVLRKIRQALDESCSINCMSLNGRFVDESERYIYPYVKIERLGSKVLFYGEKFVFDPNANDQIQETSRQRSKKARNLLDNQMDSWLIFDGTSVARYELTRFLFTRSTDEGVVKYHKSLTHFQPDNWDRPGFPFGNSSAWDLVGTSEIDYGNGVLVKIQYVREKDTTHTFTGKISGPFAERKLAITNFRISFDEKQGWHWTRFENEGGVGGGTLRTEREWKFADGYWYPARGSIGDNGPIINFQINDIKFGPENITSSFTWNENELPLGTRIIEGPVGSKNPERFSGGEEGERQYRLIKRAEMLNKTNEKRKTSR